MSKLVRQGTLRALIEEFIEVRKNTLNLFKPLKIEDAVIQSSDFGSPPNWHIAHVSWFFHQILNKYGRKKIIQTNVTDINLHYLNSYYQKFGEMLPKQERGKFPRPTVQDTLKYRSLIEQEIISLLEDTEIANNEKLYEDIAYHVTLGNQHEMQHQELMLYDLQHYYQRFSDARDNYKPSIVRTTPLVILGSSPLTSQQQGQKGEKYREERLNEDLHDMVNVPGGIYELGFNGKGFCYDNELPQHKVYLNSFRMDVAPVTNGEFIKFIEDAGYEHYRYWLADGWEVAKDRNWKAPLYWEFREEDSAWIKKDFRGINKVDLEEPITNISYYEADAYAKWARKRLPTEAEWEKAASWNEDLHKKTIYPWGNDKPTPRRANLMESYLWGPSQIGTYPGGKSYYGCHQMIGDIWEWTSSEYILYPAFQSKFSEYTDKWAINQKVLRGGSFATPSSQIRNSYRNYFRPQDRIPFSGFRCAKDIG
jgi:ergothioneine biosynthesis protein EgtB